MTSLIQWPNLGGKESYLKRSAWPTEKRRCSYHSLWSFPLWNSSWKGWTSLNLLNGCLSSCFCFNKKKKKTTRTDNSSSIILIRLPSYSTSEGWSHRKWRVLVERTAQRLCWTCCSALLVLRQVLHLSIWDIDVIPHRGQSSNEPARGYRQLSGKLCSEGTSYARRWRTKACSSFDVQQGRQQWISLMLKCSKLQQK